jgi:hypothetical protein
LVVQDVAVTLRALNPAPVVAMIGLAAFSAVRCAGSASLALRSSGVVPKQRQTDNSVSHRTQCQRPAKRGPHANFLLGWAIAEGREIRK